jgi:hypothetical protein
VVTEATEETVVALAIRLLVVVEVVEVMLQMVEITALTQQSLVVVKVVMDFKYLLAEHRLGMLVVVVQAVTQQG